MSLFFRQVSQLLYWSFSFTALLFAQSSLQLATASPQPVRHWTSKHEFSIGGHANRISAVALAPDGKIVASASNNRVILSAAETGKVVRQLVATKGMTIFSLAFSPDGRWLAAGLAQRKEARRTWVKGKPVVTSVYVGETLIWDAQTGEIKARLNAKSAPTWTVAFSPDGHWLAVGTGPLAAATPCRANCQGVGAALLWETQNWQLRRTYTGAPAPILALAFAPDGKTFAGSSGMLDALGSLEMKERFEIFLWDTNSDKTKHVLPGHLSPITSLAFAPDGRWLASAGRDRQLKLWNSATFELERAASDFMISLDELESVSDKKPSPAKKDQKDVVPTRSWLNVLAFSQNGEQIVGGGGDGIVRIYETATCKLSQFLRPRDWPIFSWAARPDVNRIVFQQMGISPWPPAYGVLNALALSADNRFLVTGNADGKVRVLWFD